MSTLSTTFLKTALAPRNPDQVYSCPPKECIQEFYDDYDGDVPSVISFLSLYISHLSYFPKFHSIANTMRQYEVNSKAMACSIVLTQLYIEPDNDFNVVLFVVNFMILWISARLDNKLNCLLDM